MAPLLFFLGADDVLAVMAERLAARPGRGAATPGGLFGDALRIANAASEDERNRLKARLRKRILPHLFRWMDHGHHCDVAYMLHALFPRPDGPPSRLIESLWNHLPDIELPPGSNLYWDVVKKRSR